MNTDMGDWDIQKNTDIMRQQYSAVPTYALSLWRRRGPPADRQSPSFISLSLSLSGFGAAPKEEEEEEEETDSLSEKAAETPTHEQFLRFGENPHVSSSSFRFTTRVPRLFLDARHVSASSARLCLKFILFHENSKIVATPQEAASQINTHDFLPPSSAWATTVLPPSPVDR